ncbi:hypothetical protein, partial [Methanoculleus sp. UBA208]
MSNDVYRWELGVQSSKMRIILVMYDTDAIGVQEQSQRGKSPVQWTVGDSTPGDFLRLHLARISRGYRVWG